MLNVLFAADFDVAKTGIMSSAAAILAQGNLGKVNVFCDRPLFINGVKADTPSKLLGTEAHLIFTHTEYSGLAALQRSSPDALMHVGDWPFRHWDSVRAVQPIRGTLAKIRCHIRLRGLDRRARLAFVTAEDCASAVAGGFTRAVHIPLGVAPPTEPLAPAVDFKSICFSGNFRYAPNRDAALRLLRLARDRLAGFRVILVGFYADDFYDEMDRNVEIHASVPSVVDFLAKRRPIYVSLIDTGAGAKNKILEAMAAGCPIVCTPQSLDSSIPMAPSIKIVADDNDAELYLRKLTSSEVKDTLTATSRSLADETHQRRSWGSVAATLRALITPFQQVSN